MLKNMLLSVNSGYFLGEILTLSISCVGSTRFRIYLTTHLRIQDTSVNRVII